MRRPGARTVRLSAERSVLRPHVCLSIGTVRKQARSCGGWGFRSARQLSREPVSRQTKKAPSPGFKRGRPKVLGDNCPDPLEPDQPTSRHHIEIFKINVPEGATTRCSRKHRHVGRAVAVVEVKLQRRLFDVLHDATTPI